MISEAPVIAPGSAVQAGRPETRPLEVAILRSQEMRPLRCDTATQITSAVAAMAAAVPQITSPIGAPFAGSLDAAAVTSVARLVICPSPPVGRLPDPYLHGSMTH